MECGRCGDEEEGLTAQVRTGMKMPGREERERHEATHIPYRSWCEQCVRGRGQDRQHRRKSDEEQGRNTLSID